MARIPRQLAGIGAAGMTNAAQFDSYVGPSREVTVDPVRGIMAIHDGSTAGGKRIRVSQSFSTVADLIASSAAVGEVIETLGYFAANDGGGATYRITAATGGAPDGFGEHTLANGRYARLVHNGVLKGEWFGCVSGLESSARFNALNTFARTVRNLTTYNSVTVTQNAYTTIKDPVLFGSGNEDGGDDGAYHVKLLGRIEVVTGGALAANSTLYALTLAGFDHSDAVLPRLVSNYICNGVKIAGYVRGTVSGGYVTRASETCIAVVGNCGVTNFYSLKAHQKPATVPQGDLNGHALLVDTADIAFFGGQFGLAKWPIWIRGGSGVHFIRTHAHNGSTTTARVNPVAVMNDGVFNIRFENAYFDNGYVVDRAGSLGLTNCFTLFVGAWVTLTHPLVRINIGSGSYRRTVLDDYRGTVGYYSGGDYLDLDNLGNSTTKTTLTYTDGSSRVNMSGTKIDLPVPQAGDEVTAVQEYYQYYDKVATTHLPLRWTVRKNADVTTWEWDGDTIRMRSPSRGSATLGIQFGLGQLGVKTGNSQRDLVFGSATADRWRITDATGTFLPETDNTQWVGSAAKKVARVYSNEYRVGSAGTVSWTAGTGSPEGVVTAPIGSMYSRTDGGTNTTLYVKQSGTGNTGWAAK
jgi:hypothetical protein